MCIEINEFNEFVYFNFSKYMKKLKQKVKVLRKGMSRIFFSNCLLLFIWFVFHKTAFLWLIYFFVWIHFILAHSILKSFSWFQDSRKFSLKRMFFSVSSTQRTFVSILKPCFQTKSTNLDLQILITNLILEKNIVNLKSWNWKFDTPKFFLNFNGFQ